MEVAARGQDVGTAAGRRAARARCDEAAGEGVHQRLALGRPGAVEPRPEIGVGGVQDGPRGHPFRWAGGIGQERFGQDLEALDGVAGGPPGARRERSEDGGLGPVPGGGEIAGERIEAPEAEIVGECPQERAGARAVAAVDAKKRHHQLAPGGAFGARAEDVQPVADLQLLELAEVVVEGREARLVIGRDAEAEIGVEAEPLGRARDLALEMLRASTVEARRLVILVDQLLQLGIGAVALRPCQRRGEVVDDHRRISSLRLTALARIVDDEGIDVRHRPEHRLRPRCLVQRHRLARQPLEIAVLAHMYARLQSEFLPQPDIKSQIAVRRHEVGVVIGGLGGDVVAAARLDADDDVAERQDRQGEGEVLHVRVMRRRAPAGEDGLAQRRRQGGEGRFIVGERQARAHLAGRAIGERIGWAGREAGDQLSAVRGQVRRSVAGLLEPTQRGSGARRGVETDPVGEPAVLVGVVGQNERDAALGHRRAREPRPGRGEPGDPGAAPEVGDVAGERCLHLGVDVADLTEGDGAGVETAVDLGQRHLHGEVARSEPARRRGPRPARLGGEARLQHGPPAGVEERALVAEREGGEVDDDVERWLGEQRRDDGGGLRVLEARGVHRAHAEALRLQRSGERVDGLGVPGLDQRPIEDERGVGPRGRRRVAVEARWQKRRGLLPGPRGRGDGGGEPGEQMARVVRPAVHEVEPEPASGLDRGGRPVGEIGIGAVVARQERQGDAPRPADGGEALDPVRPVAATAEEPDDDIAGVRHDPLGVEVDRVGMVELEKVGQAQARCRGAERAMPGLEHGELGLGGREDDQIGGRLGEIDRLAAVGVDGGGVQQMQGGPPRPFFEAEFARAAAAGQYALRRTPRRRRGPLLRARDLSPRNRTGARGSERGAEMAEETPLDVEMGVQLAQVELSRERELTAHEQLQAASRCLDRSYNQ